MAEETTPTTPTESARILPRIISDIHRLARLNPELATPGSVEVLVDHTNHSDHTNSVNPDHTDSVNHLREREILTSVER